MTSEEREKEADRLLENLQKALQAYVDFREEIERLLAEENARDRETFRKGLKCPARP